MAPSRRAVLHGAGVALAGCTTGGLGDPPRLGRLGVTNADTQAHVIHVLLFEGDDPVYWTSKRVPAAEGGVLGTAMVEGYPADAEPSRLLARRDDQSLSAAARFDVSAHDADRLGLRIDIGDDARPPALSIWYTAGAESGEAPKKN